ncbi:glycosyl transferase family WbsX [Rhodococcus rhodochrous J38]|uniref:glycoside hydrolase family 99-like domain-containing protein n=1 Tax=Rhodococcus rhodochrous TaxID=1829 RepID=UPI00119FB7A1|nr:glycosyl transferase family WbsX [Rhodococcus rhodochrous J38]
MNRPVFIAYVYPGWHADSYRPKIDEWDLLFKFRPYFKGHQRPARPAYGLYDDTLASTASRQISEAQRYGIHAFTYFLYWGADGFVMGEPMEVAWRVSAHSSEKFMIGGTWCVRLPHNRFPVTPGDSLEIPEGARSDPLLLEDRRIDDLTIRELERLIPDWDDSWLVNSRISRRFNRRVPGCGVGPDGAGVSPTQIGLLPARGGGKGFCASSSRIIDGYVKGSNLNTITSLRRLIDDLCKLNENAPNLADVVEILKRHNWSHLFVESVMELLAIANELSRLKGTASDLTPRRLENLFDRLDQPN